MLRSSENRVDKHLGKRYKHHVEPSVFHGSFLHPLSATTRCRARPLLSTICSGQKGQNYSLVAAFFSRIGESLDVLGGTVEEMIGWATDVSGMIAGRFETIENKLPRLQRRPALKALILIESADEEKLVAKALRRLTQVAVAAHRWRGHGLEAIGLCLNDHVQHRHESAAEMVYDLETQFVVQRILLLVVR